MNILGGGFTEGHLKYVQKAPASHNWIQGEIVQISSYIESCEIEPLSIPIYFELKSLNKISVPCIREVNSDLKKYIDAVAIGKEKKVQIEGHTIIKHRPNKLNFWHVELHINDGTRKGEIKEAKSWRENTPLSDQPYSTQLAYHVLKEVLVTSASQKKEYSSKISISNYINWNHPHLIFFYCLLALLFFTIFCFL